METPPPVLQEVALLGGYPLDMPIHWSTPPIQPEAEEEATPPPPQSPQPQEPKAKATAGSWKPGQSGNPGGRPHGYVPFAPMLRRALAKTDRRNRSQLEKIAEKVVALALKGDMDAVRWLADRVDGRVAQQLNVSSEQTVHVVPWLPAIKEAAEVALPQRLIEAEATAVEDAVEDAAQIETLENLELREAASRDDD